MVANTPNEVDLILDDIRDTLQPNKNPDCTFTSRRSDKRIQERLIDISEHTVDQLTNTVYSRDQEQSAVGWQNVVPYATYVDKLKVAGGSLRGRARLTNPVDNSTIVRHLQERIRKWADRKPQLNNCIHRRRTYTNIKNSNSALSVAPQHKPIVSAIELTPDLSGVSDAELGIKRLNSNDPRETEPSERSHEKFPVSWNLLSHNEATHMNYQTYGMDPSITYVPDRGKGNSHISNYTATKQLIPDHRQQGGAGYRGRSGVLHPARNVRYRRKQNKFRDNTVDMTEEAEDGSVLKYKDKFKCSICIEGLQVAGTSGYEVGYYTSAEVLPPRHMAVPGAHSSERLQRRCDTCRPVPLYPSGADENVEVLYNGTSLPLQSHLTDIWISATDWPTHIEYSAGDTKVPVSHSNNANKPSESLQTYKLDKTGVPDNPGFRVPESVMRVPETIKPETIQRDQAAVSSVSLNNGTSGQQKQKFGLVIKDSRTVPTSVGYRRKKQPEMYLKGKCSLEKSCKLLKKLNTEREANRDKIPTLFDRFHATKSGKKQRKMYGVSICDVYTANSPTEPEGDLFNYGLFLSTPPSKQKLDPLINIKPLYIN